MLTPAYQKLIDAQEKISQDARMLPRVQAKAIPGHIFPAWR